MFYLVNSVNFIKYLNYFLQIKFNPPPSSINLRDINGDKGMALLGLRLATASRP